MTSSKTEKHLRELRGLALVLKCLSRGAVTSAAAWKRSFPECADIHAAAFERAIAEIEDLMESGEGDA